MGHFNNCRVTGLFSVLQDHSLRLHILMDLLWWTALYLENLIGLKYGYKGNSSLLWKPIPVLVHLHWLLVYVSAPFTVLVLSCEALNVLRWRVPEVSPTLIWSCLVFSVLRYFECYFIHRKHKLYEYAYMKRNNSPVDIGCERCSPVWS